MIKIPLLIFIILNLVSCAGTGPNPTRVYQFDDKDLTCSDILNEFDSILIDLNINLDNHKQTRKKNISYYIAGQLLLIPTLGMDVTGSNEIKKRSLVMRLERLEELSKINNC